MPNKVYAIENEPIYSNMIFSINVAFVDLVIGEENV